MSYLRGAWLAVFVFSAAAGLPAGAADPYPVRSIRLISPFPPGGGNDTLARILVDKLYEGLGQRMIVENRPGANTIVGTEVLAKAAPDGYTVILLPNTFVTNPSFYRKLPYDTVKDFAPVGLIALSPQMIVAHPSFPATTVKQLIALARARPGEVNYSSSGNGSVGHLAGILLGQMTRTEFVHIPYKGNAPAVIDLLGGHLPLMISSTLSTLPHVRSGKLRIIAVTTALRSPAIPAVPTVAESGLAGYEATLWYGMIAPARTPVAAIERLNAELEKALRLPDVVEKLSSQGVEPYYSTAEKFGERIREEILKWAKVIAASGARAD